MSAVMKKIKVSLLLLSSLLFAQNGQAAFMIDDFLDFQEVENGSTLPMPVIHGTQLTNLTRTLTATPSASPGVITGAVVDDFYGQLSIDNRFGSQGTASVFYSFDQIDLTTVADALVFDLDAIDLLGHEIQVIANTSSIYGFAAMNAIGLHTILFSQFSDASVFQQLTSLQINFRGAKSWDAMYGSISANTTVPEPSVIALLSIGLLLMGRVSRKAYA